MQPMGGLALIVSLAWTQPSLAAGALDEVLDADRAFAAEAAETGVQGALLDFLAPDGVLFRPTAVNGRGWLHTHEEASGRLEWAPTAGVVACDGELAFTAGPWTYRQGAASATGIYLTVWRGGADGEWSIALDHGIDSVPGAPEAGDGALAALAAHWSPPAGRACGRGGPADGVVEADRRMNEAIREGGMASALARFAGKQPVIFRDGHPPAVLAADWPRDDAALGPGLEAVTGRAEAGAGSDLGYSYGTIVGRDKNAPEAEARAVYVRLWARRGGEWSLAADMLTTLAAAAAASR